MKNKIHYLGKRFFKNELVNGSFYLFLGSLISSFIAFIANLFFARNLSASDYGIYASLLSLLTLTTIPSQSLMSVITRFAADFFSKNKIGEAIDFYKRSSKFMIFVSAFLLFVFIIFTNQIKNYLKIDNGNYIILVGVTVFFQYLYIVNNAYLQSLLKFFYMAFNTVVSAVLRFILGVILIFLGYKVFGALISILIAFIAPVLISFFPLRILFSKSAKTCSKINTGEIFGYAIPTAIAILSLTSFISMDVIMTKHFFTPKQAGLYGGLSLIGRVIFYFTSAIPSVMFPLLIKRHSKGEDTNNLFYLALFLVIFPSFVITTFYYLYPKLTVGIFLGKDYYEIIPYLGLFGIFISVYSILNVCVNFFLSLKKTMIFIPVTMFTILQVLLINIYHESFFQIIGISILCSSSLLLVLFIYFFKNFFKFNQIKNLLMQINNPLN